MKSIEINVTARKNLGKKDSRALRLDKQVPCVLYGGSENVFFSAHENTFKDILYSHNVFLVTLNLDGKKYQAVVKETQFHPVTDKLLHVDFLEVSADKPAVIHLPVELTGTSVGVIEGGKLRLRKRYLKVKGLVADIPDTLVIDISPMTIGQSVLAEDLSFEKIEILEPRRSAVVSVISSRAAAKGMGEETTEGAAAAVAAEGAAAPAEGAAASAPEKADKAEKAEKPEKPKK